MPLTANFRNIFSKANLHFILLFYFIFSVPSVFILGFSYLLTVDSCNMRAFCLLYRRNRNNSIDLSMSMTMTPRPDEYNDSLKLFRCRWIVLSLYRVHVSCARQVDGLEKAVSGDRRLRLHTARVTNGIMNAVGSMHRPSSDRRIGKRKYTQYCTVQSWTWIGSIHGLDWIGWDDCGPVF